MLEVFAKHDSAVRALAFTSDGGKLVAGSEKGNIRVYAVSSGEEIAVLRGHVDKVNSLDISLNDRFVASGSDDKTIRIWVMVYQKEVAVVRGHLDSVTSVAFSQNGKWLASGSKDESVGLWSMGSGNLKTILRFADAYKLGLSYDIDPRYPNPIPKETRTLAQERLKYAKEGHLPWSANRGFDLIRLYK